MRQRPPITTRPATLCPYTTLFRSRGPPRWAARTSCRRRTSAKPELSQFAEGARDVRAVRQAADNRVERRVRRIRFGKAGESEAVPELSVEEIGRAHV